MSLTRQMGRKVPKPGELLIRRVDGKIQITQADPVILISSELMDSPVDEFMEVTTDMVVFKDQFSKIVSYKRGPFDFLRNAYWMRRIGSG